MSDSSQAGGRRRDPRAAGGAGTVQITSMRVGLAEFGPGGAVVEDDALIVAVPRTPGERPVRVPFTTIDGVGPATDAHEVTLSLSDGATLVLASPASAGLRDAVLRGCRALPELTRALRTFGSRRGRRTVRANGAEDQQRFFAPLLQARRGAAAAASPADALTAFDAAVLGRSCTETLRAFAAERFADEGPAHRALEAELTDLAEPLMSAFEALGAAAREANASIDDLRLWRAWAADLRSTFGVADRVWIMLDAALDVAHEGNGP